MAKQTLKQAVLLASTGKSRSLARASRALVGKPEGGWGETQQARSDILAELPHRSERTYTLGEFIEAVYYVETYDDPRLGAGIFRSRFDREERR